MSKSATPVQTSAASTPPLPSTTSSSAWSRGPPPAASSAHTSQPSSTLPSAVPTPPPQANGAGSHDAAGVDGPAPATAGHARKGSLMVGGGVDIKRGSLAFGTVDQPNPLLSSSPAAPSMTGTHLADNVKSFGSIDNNPDATGSIVRPPRRVSGPTASSAAPSPAPAKKLDMHSLFGGKPGSAQGSSSPAMPPAGAMSPTPPVGGPAAPPMHDRRQSINHGPYPGMNGLPNSAPHPYQQMAVPGPPHLRPPQGMQNVPRSPAIIQGMPPGAYPGQVPPQYQQGFRVPQPGPPNGQQAVRPGANGQQGIPQGMPPRPMMGGQVPYQMYPQGQHPMMGGAYPYYPGYNPYEQQHQYGGVPQWAQQQQQQQQPHAPSLPMSPRNSQSQLSQPSPAPHSAALPSSAGVSPMPTPPSRPQSLVPGHQATASTSSIPSMGPSTPSRPVAMQGPPVFTPNQLNLSAAANSFTPRAKSTIKISRPDGTAVDLAAAAVVAKPSPSVPSSGAATPEIAQATEAAEAPKKKLALPVVVRMESEEAKAKREAEEAQKRKIKEEEEKEEAERKERQARRAKEDEERKAAEAAQDAEAAAKAAEAKAAEDKAAETKAAEDKAAAEKKTIEEGLAAEAEVARKADEAREAAIQAQHAEDKPQAEAEATAAHAAALEARDKANEAQRQAFLTPAPSMTASPLASPALGSAGLPAKPLGVAANGSRRTTPSSLDLRNAAAASPTPDTPSALGTAKPIEDIHAIKYPTAVNPPSQTLNAAAEPGKFRYDRDFLMQFMDVCKEKPESLPALEEIGLEADPSSGFGQSSRGGARAPRGAPGGRGGLGLGITGGRNFTPGQGMGSFGMGNFSSTTTLRGTTSEDRMKASLARGGAGGMARTPSQGGLPPMGLSQSRTGGARGSQRGVKRMPQDPRGSFAADPDVAPIVISANAWVNARGAGNDEKSPAYIERKVKALLNKLTEEKFPSISQQILDWANKSKDESDGITLKLVIKQVFEKATDEAHWSAMYAKLCRMLLDRLDPEVTEVIDGKPISGGSLFRKYLLGRCQVDFESGWKAREEAALAAAAKSEEDKAKLAEHEQTKQEGADAPMMSEEYYAAQKVKRRGLGLVQLIGELYKLYMLSAGVLRRCLQALLQVHGEEDQPDEEDLESAIKLLTTIGAQYEKDSPESVGTFMARLEHLEKQNHVSSRIRFMIMDLIDLRKNKWVSRKAVAPTTIAEVHAQAEREQQAKAQAAASSARDSMSRGGSRAGHARRDGPQNPGEWQSVNAPRAASRPADFSHMGRGITSAAPSNASFRPEGAFARKKGPQGVTPPISRQASTSNMNMFSALNEAGEAAPEARRPSGDAGAPSAAAPQRKKLQLAPRTKPIAAEGEDKAEGEGEGEGDDDDDDQEEGEVDEDEDEGEAPADIEMDEEKIGKKIAADVLEFWGEKGQGGSRNLADLVSFYRALPAHAKGRLSTKLVDHIFMRNKLKDADVVVEGWQMALDEGVVTKEDLVKALEPRAVTLAGDAEDFPYAFNAFAVLVRGVGLEAAEIDALIATTEILDDEDPETPRVRIDKALAKYDAANKPAESA